MIAEDYYSIDELPPATGGTTTGRHNRNLSSIVSTIRDDGPSSAQAPPPRPDREAATADNPGPVDTPAGNETPQSIPPRPRIRALPAPAVLARVVAMLVLLVMIGGLLLLASGRYPVIDGRGLRLADLPDDVVAEMAAIKAGIADRFSLWTQQAGQLLNTGTAGTAATSPVFDTAGLAAVETRQRRIVARLDALAAAVETLQSRLAEERVERLANDMTHRSETELQLQAVEARLAGLQQGLAVKQPAATAPPAAAPARRDAAGPSRGDWVVNVASSSQERSIKALQARLKQQGIDTELQPVGSGDSPRYRLRVTGFASSGEAKRYAGRLAQAFDIQGAWASKR